MGSGRAGGGDHGARLLQRRGASRHPLLLRPRLQGRRSRLRARTRWSAARSRSWSSARSVLGVPEVQVDDVRAAMGPAAARFHRRPHRHAAGRGYHGDQRQDHHRLPCARDPRARWDPHGPARHREAGGGRGGGGGRADDSRGDRPSGHLPAHARRGRRRLRDGGLLACPGVGRASGIRFAAKVFTNLTQDHLDFHDSMEAYFLAKRRLFDEPGPAVVNVDDEYGRRLAEELGCRLRDVLGRGCGRVLRRGRLTLQASTARRSTPGCRASSTSPMRSRRSRACNQVDVATAHGRGGARRGSAGTGAVRVGRGGAAVRGCSWTTRTPPTRWRTCSALRGNAHRGAAARGVRRRRGPGPRQAAADGRGGRAAGRSRDRDLRQPALGGAGGDRVPRSSRAPAPTSRARWTGAPP